MIRILGRQTSGNVQKVLFMLEEIGQKYVREDYGRQFNNTNTDAYRKLNPTMKVPTIVEGDVSSWETHTILQFGPDGEVLFQHRCQDKFRIGPERFDSTGQCSTSNQYNSRLAHEDLCFELLDELRRSSGGPWGDALVDS